MGIEWITTIYQRQRRSLRRSRFRLVPVLSGNPCSFVAAELAPKSPDFRGQPARKSPAFRGQPERKSPDFRGQPERKSPDFRGQPERKSPDFRGQPERKSGDFRYSSAAMNY